MSDKKNVTLRVEPDLKEAASELYRKLGLDLSTATRMFYCQSLRCKGIPFEVKLGDDQESWFELEESNR